MTADSVSLTESETIVSTTGLRQLHGLTPFERFIFDSEDESSPMTFRVLTTFDGPVDRELLSRSYQIAQTRHMLLNSRVDDSTGTATWTNATGNALQWLTSEEDGMPEHGLSPSYLPLRSGIGLHTECFTNADGLVIRLNFHHACCDGQAARQFIMDWYRLYDHLVRNEKLNLAPLEPERLNDRAVIRSLPGIDPVGFREGLRNFYATVSGRTVRLPRQLSAECTPVPGGAYLCERVLSEEQTAELRCRLKMNGVSINDLGISTTMAAIAQRYPAISRRHHITVLNPVDLRMPSDRYLPAANRTGFTYLRRKPADCARLEELLASIRGETTYIKSRYVGAEFIHGLAAAKRWPGLLPLIRRTGLFTPTVQFTCLGDTTRGKRYGVRKVDGVVTVGDMKLKYISGFAPVAPGVPFSVTACETNARLSITVAAAQRFASRDDGDAFADCVIESICTWADLQWSVSQ